MLAVFLCWSFVCSPWCLIIARKWKKNPERFPMFGIMATIMHGTEIWHGKTEVKNAWLRTRDLYKCHVNIQSLQHAISMHIHQFGRLSVLSRMWRHVRVKNQTLTIKRKYCIKSLFLTSSHVVSRGGLESNLQVWSLRYVTYEMIDFWHLTLDQKCIH